MDCHHEAADPKIVEEILATGIRAREHTVRLGQTKTPIPHRKTQSRGAQMGARGADAL
jgi:hypothetical protein